MLTLLCVLFKVGVILFFVWLVVCTAVFFNMRKYLGDHILFGQPTYLGKITTFLILPLPIIISYLPVSRLNELIGFLWLHIFSITQNPKEGWVNFKADFEERWKLRASTKIDKGILYTRIGRNWNYGEWREASPELTAEFHRRIRAREDWAPMSDEIQKLLIADHKRPS